MKYEFCAFNLSYNDNLYRYAGIYYNVLRYKARKMYGVRGWEYVDGMDGNDAMQIKNVNGKYTIIRYVS